MLMNFKVPFFQPQITTIGLFEWFRDFMGRWSGSDLIKARVVHIDTWNMDTTNSITRDFGKEITLGQIVGITVSITNDTQDKRYDPSLVENGFTEARVEGTDVILIRKTGGFFDNADFNSTTISRGDIIIWYTT